MSSTEEAFALKDTKNTKTETRATMPRYDKKIPRFIPYNYTLQVFFDKVLLFTGDVRRFLVLFGFFIG